MHGNTIKKKCGLLVNEPSNAHRNFDTNYLNVSFYVAAQQEPLTTLTQNCQFRLQDTPSRSADTFLCAPGRFVIRFFFYICVPCLPNINYTPTPSKPSWLSPPDVTRWHVQTVTLLSSLYQLQRQPFFYSRSFLISFFLNDCILHLGFRCYVIMQSGG
jgi:hypothetical protein